MKTVLITGASSGIGEAYAYEFGKRGYHVILTARSRGKLAKIAQALPSADCIPLDLSANFAADALYERLQGCKVDVLVNNAGFATKGLFIRSDPANQHAEIMLNVMNLTELTYHMLNDMKAQGSGTVINIASAAAFNQLPFSAVYAATKAYVLSFTEAIHYEMKEYGIHCMAVCPGATDTHFFDDFQSTQNKMRTPQDVVNTTFRAWERGKIVCTDGLMAWGQKAISHLLPRRQALYITGAVGRNAWR